MLGCVSAPLFAAMGPTTAIIRRIVTIFTLASDDDDPLPSLPPPPSLELSMRRRPPAVAVTSVRRADDKTLNAEVAFAPSSVSAAVTSFFVLSTTSVRLETTMAGVTESLFSTAASSTRTRCGNLVTRFLNKRREAKTPPAWPLSNSRASSSIVPT